MWLVFFNTHDVMLNMGRAYHASPSACVAAESSRRGTAVSRRASQCMLYCTHGPVWVKPLVQLIYPKSHLHSCFLLDFRRCCTRASVTSWVVMYIRICDQQLVLAVYRFTVQTMEELLCWSITYRAQVLCVAFWSQQQPTYISACLPDTQCHALHSITLSHKSLYTLLEGTSK